jgi:predicted nucleic acid-binding Zn ribbon protein
MPRVKYIHRRFRAKLCEICGREFSAVRLDAKTCSAKCRKAMQRRDERIAGVTHIGSNMCDAARTSVG